MEIGVHLPLIDFDGNGLTLSQLLDYAEAAEQLGYIAISANDHLRFPKPWIDGPTALAVVLPRTKKILLGTSVTLLAVRGPVAVAKALGTIDTLSGGRLVAAVGPGSSEKDYECVGLSWDERWKRLDEGVKALRALWSDGDPFVGKYYSTDGIRIMPSVVQRPSPPIWIGSWGSDAGLRRVARLADGWLASAYNTTPNEFAEALKRLGSLLTDTGKNAKTFPNALATMWFYITEDRTERDRLIREVMMNTVSRPEEILRDRLLIGSAEDAAQKLSAFAAAGLKRVLIWPIGDYIKQIETFQLKVAPLVIAG